MTTLSHAPPPRIDLTSRRERVLAFAMSRGMSLAERLLFHSAADVPAPEDDRFYAAPGDEWARSPGEIVDTRRVEVRGRRGPINADAWQLKYRSTDTRGNPVTAVTTVIVPRRSFDDP